MSVLESLRKGTDTAGTRVFIGVVFLAFIVFFARSGNDSNQTSIAATVNGTAITESDVSRVVRQMAAQRRTNVTQDQYPQLRADAIEQLVTVEVLVQEADRLGISVSTEEVARVISRDDKFKGKDGKFDQKTYDKFLKQIDRTGARYEVELRRQMTFEKLSWLALRGVNVSDEEVAAAGKEALTQLTVTYIRLPTSAFLEDVPVTDAERDDFLAKNAEKVKARYDASFDRQFNLPKTYAMHAILLRTDIPGMDDAAKAATRAKAEEIQAQLAGGADFAELARRYSEDLSAGSGGDMGVLAANQLDPVLATAADAAGVGKVSPVVETGRGLQIIRVDAITEARQIPFDEAKSGLAVTMLREERVSGVTREFASKLLAAWTTADAPPRELTAAKMLPVDTTEPFSLASPPMAPPIAKSPELEAALRTATPGSVLPVPFEIDGNLLVVALNKREEPDAEQLKSLTPMIRTRLLYDRRQAFLGDWVQAVKAEATIELPGQTAQN